MRRTQEQAMHTRARILDSAVQAFLRQGLSHTSLADIAGVAGVTRGAVYGHFRNKSALFEAMLEHAGLPVDPFLIAWHAPEPDPLEQLRAALVRHLALVLSNGVARRVYSIVHSRCEVSEETREFWEKVHRGRRAAEQRIVDALADAHAQGQLADNADIAQLAAFTHASLMGFFIRSLAEQASIAPRRSAEHVVDLAFLLLRPFEAAD
ncbi:MULTISPECIES: TetR family transcriptional regulator [Burkholderia]|uniref:TetR family transcriptional regulator n=1 Tax=Burkholderia TaxID=32008 RepID=UPI00136E8630|nr:TetR family transcriptional regulator [Burkholderia gladioli]NBI45203.1 TetR family transcriptional regulator [Burkholderia sp. ISTR5]